LVGLCKDGLAGGERKEKKKEEGGGRVHFLIINQKLRGITYLVGTPQTMKKVTFKTVRGAVMVTKLSKG